MPKAYICSMFLLNSFLQRIDHLDKEMFLTINRRWSNRLFDELMPFLRQSEYWAPLYLVLLIFVLVNFKMKGCWWAAFFICTVAITDLTGNYLFKHTIERLRPCSDPDFSVHVRLLVNHCSGGYSFISNHAANHFGMALFFYISFRNVLGRWVWTAILWAAAIAYAQVYVGVHYPIDVLAGAVWGSLIGITTGRLFNKHIGFAIFDK
ncbi:MAG TPA: phosphatase PAP2 family protein [Chitinophagaceae bacterium]|nr:phosphatase PAP2 family protein [Chitinophagaceae bacterium]HNA92557.1 phosphatase PAP2 family protein [Chitinophagaceae bacterium]HNA96714.1 phosphatase PAP2 family protein [Chitinophagaceae bacterium]HNC38171.1 phosphatase PAP2 family protein [Chitinophagaceae bacterium]HNF37652.1 phosphatase PAP2 family protein [Chitinophagaceae bacterium]